MSDVDRRTQLVAAKAERERKRIEEKDALELELLELEEKYESELGPVGRKFLILDLTELGEGFVVLKQGETVVYKRYSEAKNKTDKEVEEYVLPCLVHPTTEKFLEIVNTRYPEVLYRCAHAVNRLFGKKSEDDMGKF